jgi:hypothetical protein
MQDNDNQESKSRRVSFAATAHVRLFEKEEQEMDIEEQELQKTLEMFHPTKVNKDFDLSIHEEYLQFNSVNRLLILKFRVHLKQFRWTCRLFVASCPPQHKRLQRNLPTLPSS